MVVHPELGRWQLTNERWLRIPRCSGDAQRIQKIKINFPQFLHVYPNAATFQCRKLHTDNRINLRFCSFTTEGCLVQSSTPRSSLWSTQTASADILCFVDRWFMWRDIGEEAIVTRSERGVKLIISFAFFRVWQTTWKVLNKCLSFGRDALSSLQRELGHNYSGWLLKFGKKTLWKMAHRHTK